MASIVTASTGVSLDCVVSKIFAVHRISENADANLNPAVNITKIESKHPATLAMTVSSLSVSFIASESGSNSVNIPLHKIGLNPAYAYAIVRRDTANAALMYGSETE